ncbi:hypothetical protein [Burkholderia ubonensis]|uniref:hypothetical protein n=1 Tax=Burkholderia ubonensis TaxID=101571 RepID=UPI000ACD98C9|nr:hypothetical protein [Burkholderia ubonensis]
MLREIAQWCRRSKEVVLVLFGGLSFYLMVNHHAEADWTNVVGFVLSAVFIGSAIYTEIHAGQGKVIRWLGGLFLLVVLVTTLIGFIAHSVNWINANGAPVGLGGKFIVWLIEVMLDIKSDLRLVGWIAAIIAIWNLARLLLDERFGYQTVPRPRGILRKVLWAMLFGYAKSCVVVAGVLMPLAVYVYSWGQFNLSQLIGGELLGVSLVVAGLIFIWLNEQVCFVIGKDGASAGV